MSFENNWLNEEKKPVDAAGAVDAQDAPTSSLENTESVFSTAPTGTLVLVEFGLKKKGHARCTRQLFFTARRDAMPTGHVYCYKRIDERDCYKVGRTKVEAEKRKKGFSGGSNVPFELHRDILTDDASALENYIHNFLDLKRAANGEFFYVTKDELDDAVERAEAFIKESRPLVRDAKKLRKSRPGASVAEPDAQMLEIYKELRKLGREQFLIEKRIEFLQSRVQVAMGESALMKGVASWKWIECWTMNMPQFKKKESKLYERLFEKYKRDSGGRRFLLEQVDLTKD